MVIINANIKSLQSQFKTVQQTVCEVLEDHLAQNDKTRKQNRRFKKLIRQYENNTQIID